MTCYAGISCSSEGAPHRSGHTPAHRRPRSAVRRDEASWNPDLPRTSKIVNTTAITKRIALTHKPRSNFPIPESDRFMIVG